MWMGHRLDELTAKLRAPQYLAAVFVVGVGALFHLSLLAEILIERNDAGTKVAAVIADALFIYTYWRITWPMIFGGLGQQRLIIRTTIYAAGVAFYCIVLGKDWFDIGFLVIGLLLAVLPRLWAASAVVAFLVTMTIAAVRVHYPAAATVNLLMTMASFGAVFYVLLLLSAMLRDTVSGRAAQAQVAVLQERLRLSRDLHDVVVHSLTAIGLKAEVAQRIFDARPDDSRRELVQITDLSTRAMSQVRELVSGYRHESLRDTIEDARVVLQTAEVGFEVELGNLELCDDVEQAFCWATRESVTNALRHASPSYVRITVYGDCDADTVLEVTNDGVLPVLGRRDGNGLSGLGERLAPLGGSVATERGTAGTFTLRARVPNRSPC